MDGKVLISEYQRGSVMTHYVPRNHSGPPLMHSEETPVPRGHELPKNRRENPLGLKAPQRRGGFAGKAHPTNA